MSYRRVDIRMKLAAVLVAAAAFSLTTPSRAQFQHECFGQDWERRITACSDLILTPGISLDSLSNAYAARALAHSLLGQYDTAIRDYDAALDMVPDFPVALNNRAWAYFKSGRASQGRPDVERSLRLDPMSAHSYDTRAHIKQAAGDAAGALKDYDAAMYFGGERMIKLYQCGLQYHKLYSGPADGVYSTELRAALQACVNGTDCDPLPPDELCRPPIS